MKKKKWLPVVLAGCACLSFIGSGLLYCLPEAAVHNYFQTGVVQISLKEYAVNSSGRRVSYDDAAAYHVLPGQRISLIPRVTNEAVDCYLRIGLEFEDESISWDLKTEDLEDCFGEDWILADDGNYYYKKILPSGESVDLFQAVRVPLTMPQSEMEGRHFDIHIRADAVQARNFTPQFSAEDPWGELQVLQYTRDKDYDSTSFTTEQDVRLFHLLYEGEADALITDQEDLFSNFPVLIPGDTFQDTLQIRNDSNQTRVLYFRAENPTDNDLSDRMQLTIRRKTEWDEKTVYRGAVSMNETDSVELVRLEPGATASLEYTVSMPSELDNRYTLTEGLVNWIFTTEAAADPATVRITRKSRTQAAAPKQNDSEEENPKIAASVKTGVRDRAALMLFLWGLAFLGMLFFLRKSREVRKR